MPLIREIPNNAILHVEINGFNGVKASNRIAKSINDWSITMKSSSQNINLPSVIMCNDKFDGPQIFHCYG